MSEATTQEAQTTQAQSNPAPRPDVPPPSAPVNLKSIPPTCGRQVHVYSNLWDGPRPATVFRSAPGPYGERCTIDCNVEIHGRQDQQALNYFNMRSHGNNTLENVEFFDGFAPGELGLNLDKLAQIPAPAFFATWPIRV